MPEGLQEALVPLLSVLKSESKAHLEPETLLHAPKSQPEHQCTAKIRIYKNMETMHGLYCRRCHKLQVRRLGVPSRFHRKAERSSLVPAFCNPLAPPAF